mmetsp:Transcript_129143/g.257829  ORF Transcript_129143/g.257829 Transcript_129143/m.257829 type:complete len:243 (-) Transcript_129143:906-1634(-)
MGPFSLFATPWQACCQHAGQRATHHGSPAQPSLRHAQCVSARRACTAGGPLRHESPGGLATERHGNRRTRPRTALLCHLAHVAPFQVSSRAQEVPLASARDWRNHQGRFRQMLGPRNRGLRATQWLLIRPSDPSCAQPPGTSCRRLQRHQPAHQQSTRLPGHEIAERGFPHVSPSPCMLRRWHLAVVKPHGQRTCGLCAHRRHQLKNQAHSNPTRQSDHRLNSLHQRLSPRRNLAPPAQTTV